MSYEKLSDFNFNLPDDLIATHPAEPRDSSRLLVLDKKTGKIEHKHFFDIIDYLNAGDILVLNNSKVIPARLLAVKKETGGKVEVLLHKKLSVNTWQCLIGGKVKEGLEVEFTITHPVRAARPPLSRGELSAVLLKNNHDSTWDVQFNKSGAALMKAIEKIGEVPLPPYILHQLKMKNEKLKNSEAKKSYQTVYADANKSGSVAAPTAGLHFTPALLKKIKNKGVKILEITLYVGMGTFAPVKVEDFTKHKMHAEWVEIDHSVIEQIKNKKEKRKNSGRIIAVGTTSCRSLEACFSALTHPLRQGSGQAVREDASNRLKPTPSRQGRSTPPEEGNSLLAGDFKSWVDIFIYPGYKFKIVDAMITNFHLPKSTLLMLVSALAGKKNIDKAYREAIKKKYHFYSYGDAMLIQ
jgi:S-adenosylmethionine:tRNA ribosyltransferase-isomerase